VAQTSDDPASVYQTLYLDRASPGLQDFVRLRIESADGLVRAIEQLPGYYATIEHSTLQVARMEPAIRAAFYALAYLFPEARFPDVYFVIGRLNSGGTVSQDGTTAHRRHPPHRGPRADSLSAARTRP
jgi:hypothetical protein